MIPFYTYLQRIKGYLDARDSDALAMSLDDVHFPGLFSLVIKNDGPGQLTRVFMSHNEIPPLAIQYHSHRYPIKLTVLSGSVTQHSAKWDEYGPVTMDVFKYRSPLNGGDGLTIEKRYYPARFTLTDFRVPVGSMLAMRSDEIHTISCSAGSIWIVEEQGFETVESTVLGVPFTTGNLYKARSTAYIYQRLFQVQERVNEILKSYQPLI